MNPSTKSEIGELLEELRQLKEEEKLLRELDEKLTNERLKLEREQMAIRGAILKREKEQKDNNDI